MELIPTNTQSGNLSSNMLQCPQNKSELVLVCYVDIKKSIITVFALRNLICCYTFATRF